jgi:Tol biopolymer transport system component
MFSRIDRTLRIALGFAVLAVASSPAEAQYFGRNKVQYQTFDFRTLRTPNFDIYFYPEEEAAVRDAARMAERWYLRLSRVLDHRFEQRQPIVLYASSPEFQQTVTTRSELGEGTGGFTDVFKQRIVMPFAYTYEETDHVLGHEMVHAFQFDISGLGRAGGGLEQAARRYQVPLWFSEGMAEYLSIGPVDPHTTMWLRDAAITGQIPSIDRMTRDPRVFPYRWGHALWAYVGGRWGDAVIGQILKQVGQGVPYEEAFQRILNVSLEDLSEEWHTSIRRAYLPLVADRLEAREAARPLISQRREGGRLNLGPAISPDGRQVAYLSERGFLDVELHLANAETGEFIRTLVRGTAFDPHFSSLRYIYSAGTWSPDGRQLAFSAQRGPSDVLVTLDVRTARILREYRIPGVGEIGNPTWSPDGQSVVFSGLRGGISDLYALDLRSGQARRLTQDRFGDLHPSYSPDGRTIAFVTERGTDADAAVLRFSGYRIALLDVASGQVRVAPQMAGTHNINPEWTRDGSGLFFISNRFGIPNIFRLTLASGQLTRVTNLFTGVSGITDLSPAITAARNSDRLLFAAYERGGYNIYALSGAQQLAGTAITQTQILAVGDTIAPAAAVLPPVPRPREPAFNRVATALADARTGLPRADTVYPAEPYRARLGLDYLGQPQVGVSSRDAFGRGGVYGGIAGIFSDILGYHTLFGTVQAQGQLDEIGGSLAYIYSKYRWNYGVVASRIPYIFGQYQVGINPENPNEYLQRLARYRIFDSSIQGLAQYPFSRVQRVEFTAGPRRLAQDVQNLDNVYHFPSGQLIDQRRSEQEMGSLNLLETSGALVYDNSLFGYTSPFAGQRYRFELSPTFGNLNYLQVLADYRRYQLLRPITLAVQGLHFARHGADAEEQTILTRNVYLGHPSLVRGYQGVYSDCVAGSQDLPGQDRERSCNLLNQMFGSRIGVAKAELRFPLIRQLVVGTGIGLPPIEGIAFADAGVAWGRGQTPGFFERGILPDETRRGLITSAGVGARVNLFGYFILEVDYLRAFELQRGWRWNFALQPGF